MEQQSIIAEFEKSTQDFISRHQLLSQGDTVIVAFSGGADSLALLSVMHRLNYNCIAAHCNFHLRGQESNRDMQHASSIAKRIGVEFAVNHFDVGSLHKSASGESIEMICRRVRYDWFNELATQHQCRHIAVGHHLEDRVETFILNLLRSSGIVGLTSMNVRNGAVIRPLLWASRDQIESYTSALCLTYVNDSSNAANDYSRNKLRNIILPSLNSLFPGANAAIIRSIENLESIRHLFLDHVAEIRRNYVEQDGAIHLKELSKLPESATLLLELLRNREFTPTQIADMLGAADYSGRSFISKDGIKAETDHGLLKFYPATDKPQYTEYAIDINHDICEPIHLNVTIHDISEFTKPDRNPNVAFFDADYALPSDAKWSVRHWQRGDRMVPFGATKAKLISDIFANAKYSCSEKHKSWLLLRNGTVVWIPGLRASATGAIAPDTKRYLRIEYMPIKSK